MTAEEFAAAELYDPGAPNAAERLALLRWLAARGVGLEEMVAAHRSGVFPALVADLALRPGPRLTLAELAAHGGLDPKQIEDIRMAAGLPAVGPDDRVFSEEDAITFASFVFGAAQFGEVAVRRFTRVIGSSLARIAEAAVSLFYANVEGPIREAGATALDIAQANLRAIESLEAAQKAMVGLFRMHMETAIHRLRLAVRPSYDSAHLTVGFVDLVGFTALSRRMTGRELGTVVDRFEDAAHDIATARGGRIVKVIGDEVMIATITAGAACDIALALVEQFAGDPSITPRGGMATGDLLIRGGDYYGPVVNLAARLAELAVPGELLVTTEVAAEAGGVGLRFAPAGRRLPKGFEDPVTLLTVERAPSAG